MKVTTMARKETAADAVPLVEVTAEDYREPLIISTFGHSGGGKSRIIGTAPGDIGVIPMEVKSRLSILKAAAEFGRKVIMPEKELIRVGNPMLLATLPAACVSPDRWTGKGHKQEDMEKLAAREMDRISKEIGLNDQPECCAIHFYRGHVNRVKSVAFRMAAMNNIRTIGIDTFGQLVEDMLFANYGRTDRIMPLDRKSFNQEVRDFLNALSHKNLILTHHAAQVWSDNKPTSKYKPASSFAKIGHYTSVAVRQERVSKPVDGGPAYTLSCLDCQANAGLIGVEELLVDEDICFQNLALAVYEDSSIEDWI
jgi:hypothetical protein